MFSAVAFLLTWAALGAMWIAAIVSAVRYPDAAYVGAGRTRAPTIVLVAITGWVGGGYYWMVIRREIEHYRNATAA